MPLLQHYGNVKAANKVLDSSLATMMRIQEDVREFADYSLTHLISIFHTPMHLYLLGRGKEAAQLMRTLKVDWDNAEKTVAMFDKRQNIVMEEAPGCMKTSHMLTTLRSLYALLAGSAGQIELAQLQEFVATLPSPRAMAMAGVIDAPQFGMGPFNAFHLGTIEIVRVALVLNRS